MKNLTIVVLSFFATKICASDRVLNKIVIDNQEIHHVLPEIENYSHTLRYGTLSDLIVYTEPESDISLPETLPGKMIIALEDKQYVVYLYEEKKDKYAQVELNTKQRIQDRIVFGRLSIKENQKNQITPGVLLLKAANGFVWECTPSCVALGSSKSMQVKLLQDSPQTLKLILSNIAFDRMDCSELFIDGLILKADHVPQSKQNFLEIRGCGINATLPLEDDLLPTQVQTSLSTNEKERIIIPIRENYVIKNDAEITLQHPLYIEKGRLMLPLQELLPIFNIPHVEFNENDQTVLCSTAHRSLFARAQSNNIRIQKQALGFGTKSMMVDDIFYIPAKLLAIAFQYDVSWDQDSESVIFLKK